MSNNSRRLLSLLELLRKKSDHNHPLKENEIKALLTQEDISIANRKTIYSDIATLIDYGFDIIYDTYTKGYYLEEAPFRLSEIRILLDCVSSLNNIDDKTKEELSSKISSFISEYESDFLSKSQLNIQKKNTLRIGKKDQSYLDRLELLLNALANHQTITFTYNGKSQEVYPYTMHYASERYYLYVLFPDSENIYSYRIDRMSNLEVSDERFDFNEKTLIKIQERIRTSFDSYDKSTPEIILLETDNYEEIEKRLKDDFPDHYLNNRNQIILEYRPNEIFFSRLVSYGSKLKIVAPDNVIQSYIEYLKSIIEAY